MSGPGRSARLGGQNSGSAGGLRGDSPPIAHAEGQLISTDFEPIFRNHWWAAVGSLARLVPDLGMAEDAVQEACLTALVQWPRDGIPANPRSWLIGVARHKAVDRLRHETRRGEKEAETIRRLDRTTTVAEDKSLKDDQLALIFMCCHPALDQGVQVALTLREVCGLTTREIAAAFLVSEATMAKRLVRGKEKIRTAGIPFRVPPRDTLASRLEVVLKVIYLIFTEGHMPTGGPTLVRDDLCADAIWLARCLTELLPDEPELLGLFAMLLLTDARRPARLSPDGEVVVLEEQDRTLWNQAQIAEGRAVLDRALRVKRSGPYQLWAAIAASHAEAASAADTDWKGILSLYDALLVYEPTPVVQANRAIAVAMVKGPEGGLAILDRLIGHDSMRSWAQLPLARAELLRRLGRRNEAIAAYRAVQQHELSDPERRYVERRLNELLPLAESRNN